MEVSLTDSEHSKEEHEPEGITQITASARTRLALHREINLRQIIRIQLDTCRGLLLRRSERFIGGRSLRDIFFLKLLAQAAGAVFARAPALTGFGTAF